MKTSRIILPFLILSFTWLPASAAAPKLADFKISGGQTVQLPVTDAGPALPAQSGPYKMNVAGWKVAHDEKNNPSSLAFTFGTNVQEPAKPARFLVEDVSEENARVLVDDRAPIIQKKYWRGDSEAQPLSASSTPWLFDGKVTLKVFKITIWEKDGSETVLYQPARYSPEDKKRALAPKKNAEYAVDDAVKIAAKLIPKGTATGFSVFNLPVPKAKPKDLLKNLRAAAAAKSYLAITSPKTEFIRDLLATTMKLAGTEHFDGLNLIIVGDKIDASSFEPILKDRGINVQYASY